VKTTRRIPSPVAAASAEGLPWRATACFAALVAIAWSVLAGNARAHGGEDHSHDAVPAPVVVAASGAPQRLADGSLFVPKAVQYQLGLRTTRVTMAPLSASVEFNGHVIADPHAGGRVQATQDGRIEPAAKGLAVLGQRVAKGEVLAQLRPVASSIDLGNQRAQLAELDAALALAERRVARYEQLAGAVPDKEIEAARIELASLKRRRAAVAVGIESPLPLRSPVAGVVAAVNVVNGQVVEAREVLFEVIDPAHLAVEALAYDPALVDGLGEASAAVPGGRLQLDYVGGGRVLREQAMPLLFRVRETAAPLAVGQPLKVVARTTRTVAGAALPRSALVRSPSGENVVWVKTGAERFATRRISHQPLDAERLAVVGGLDAGDRVVVEGATLLSQIR